MEFTDNESIRGIWIFVGYESFRHHPIEWHYLFDCLKALNFRSELIDRPSWSWGHVTKLSLENLILWVKT